MDGETACINSVSLVALQWTDSNRPWVLGSQLLLFSWWPAACISPLVLASCIALITMNMDIVMYRGIWRCCCMVVLSNVQVLKDHLLADAETGNARIVGNLTRVEHPCFAVVWIAIVDGECNSVPQEMPGQKAWDLRMRIAAGQSRCKAVCCCSEICRRLWSLEGTFARWARQKLVRSWRWWSDHLHLEQIYHTHLRPSNLVDSSRTHQCTNAAMELSGGIQL